jgi:hypothetical protein
MFEYDKKTRLENDWGPRKKTKEARKIYEEARLTVTIFRATDLVILKLL